MHCNSKTHKTAASLAIGLLILLSFRGSMSGVTALRAMMLRGTDILHAGEAQTPTTSYKYLFSFRHDDIVTCAAFSTDGRRLATGSELGTVLVTDIESRKEIAIKNPDSRDNGVVGLTFSQDGQFLVVGGYGNKSGGGEIKILRTSDYTSMISLDAPGDKEISSVGLSPDNKWLFSSDRGDVWVWNLKTRSVAWHRAFQDSAIFFDGDHEVLLVERSASLGVPTNQIVFLNLIDFRAERLAESKGCPARETLEDGVAEVSADEPLPGEAREHCDGEVGEPVALDIGDDYCALGDPRKSGEELRRVIQGEIVQHHRRQHEVEAVPAEGQVTRVAAHVPDFREAARASRSACHRLAVSVDSNDLQWTASLAAPLHQPACDVAGAAADIQHPDLARWNTRNQRRHAHDNASSAAAEAVGGGQLVQRSPG